MGAEASSYADLTFEKKNYNHDDKIWKFSNAYNDEDFVSVFTLRDSTNANENLLKKAVKVYHLYSKQIPTYEQLFST